MSALRKPRKRVVPQLLPDNPAEQEEEHSRDLNHRSHSQQEPVTNTQLSSDPPSTASKEFEICRGTGPKAIKCLKNGIEVWQWRAPAQPLTHFSTCDSLVAITTGSYLTILKLHEGTPVHGPLCLQAESLHLEMVAEAMLIMLLRDGTVEVLDATAGESLICTSLQGICEPDEVRAFTLSKNQDLLVHLKDGSLHCFKQNAQSWLSLQPLAQPSDESLDYLMHLHDDEPRKSFQAEADVMTAASIGDSCEFLLRVASFVQQCCKESESDRLVRFCKRLLDESAVTVQSQKPWLAREIGKMDLTVQQLILDTVLPGVAAKCNAALEIEALLRPPKPALIADLF